MLLGGTPVALVGRTVQSCRMRKPGPPSHLRTASALRHSPAATGTEGDRASRLAEHSAGSRDADHGGDQAQREDKAGRATWDAALPLSTRDLPDARDVLPNIQMAELDGRKLSDYSLNPEHPGNNGKADGWRALGYDVDNPEGRRAAARELRGLICDELLARGNVAKSRDTAYGPSHRVVSDLAGPNGRHANLVHLLAHRRLRRSRRSPAHDCVGAASSR